MSSKSKNTGNDDQPDCGISCILFPFDPLDKEVGIVYIVTNDYHADLKAALRDNGIDSQHVKNLFSNLEDKYHITTAQSVTYNKFVATCEYLSRYKYPDTCKRIIIYFGGHGSCDAVGEYITMEADAKQNSKGPKVYIKDILSYFRNETCRDMERIILLDACCGVKQIKCEDNELVACANSENCEAQSLPWIGGYWTNELWLLFKEKESYDFKILLDDVEVALKKKHGQTPSYRGKLRNKIILKKGMLFFPIYANLDYVVMCQLLLTRKTMASETSLYILISKNQMLHVLCNDTTVIMPVNTNLL